MREYVVPDGMPRSVFESKYSRPGKDGRLQSYAERVTEVVDGNYLLDPRGTQVYQAEQARMRSLAVAGVIPTSGRHLQHGDAAQPDRIMELHTNCSTSIFSFMLFRLLLRGSGVGRDYSAAACRVDWANMPDIRLCLADSHSDFTYSKFRGYFQPVREAQHQYDPESERVRWFKVGDSREGWAKTVEILETAAWQGKHKDKLFIFDFSDVRPEGAPIMGLQGRPASGPLSIMEALARVAHIKAADMRPWKQALFIDHALAECVQWGGARRSARMSTKSWRDRDVIEFIDVKRGGFLWSSNNSILVDRDFWEKARDPKPSHARRVFEAAAAASYWDSTGEPGFINIDLLCDNREGMEEITGENYIDKSVYVDLHPRTQDMVDNVLEHVKRIPIPYIVNPCGEIVLATYGGYCVDGSTRILHRDGYDQIRDLVGKKAVVFNGQEWSTVEPYQTGQHQKLVRVTASDGSYLDCTPYHRFAVRNGRQSPLWSEKQACELVPGDILPTFRVTGPPGNGELVGEAYTYGAFLGDGSIEHRSDSGGLRFSITLYEGKHHLPVTGTRGSIQANTGIKVTVSHLEKDRLISLKEPALPEWVFRMSGDSTLEFIRGWLDTDGVYHVGVGGVSISTCEEGRARDLQLLLRRIGISYASVREAAKIGDMTNFGPRNRPLWIVYVPASEASIINGHRVATDYELNLDHVVKQPRVVSVVELPGEHDTFCFTEPKRGMGVFGNMLTYQCVIGDICLAHVEADNLNAAEDEAIEAARLLAMFLVRTNRMKCEYAAEVKRTNRIGVALTGIHEFAYKHYGLTFHDLVNYQEDNQFYPAHWFWKFIDRMRQAVEDAATEYSLEIGMVPPHTFTTIKPSGTISKVMNCTEGAHLPALAYYIRWVQYKFGDRDLEILKQRGYPIKDVSHRYAGHCCVGFPTKQPICDLMGAKVVVAQEATPEQQYRWVTLLERYWMGGDKRNNQVSYTLKYDPKLVSYLHYMDLILEWQPKVRCISVLPSADWQETEKVYGYVPEQPVTQKEYEDLMASVKPVAREGFDEDTLECESGICPIEPSVRTVSVDP